MKVCPMCQRRVDDHDLEQAWSCLEVIAESARALAERACGGSTAAAIERREMRRPSPSWRT
jgi:hypothetical protein